MFGEKYGDEVRVVTLGEHNNKPYSIELCGGTHVKMLKKLEKFLIINEESVSSGVRRIEALHLIKLMNLLVIKKKRIN